MFCHLPSVGPKQLYALAHLGCTRKAGTSYCLWKALDEMSKAYVLFKKGGYAMFAYDDGTKPKF